MNVQEMMDHSWSSFCIYGIKVDEQEADRMILRTRETIEKLLGRKRSNVNLGDVDWQNPLSVFCAVAVACGENFVACCPDGWRVIFLGRKMASIGPEETGAQLMSGVEKKLHRAFGECQVCSTHEFSE